MAEAKDFKVHRRTKAWPRPDEKPVRGFAVDELDVSYDGFAGSPIEHKTRIVFERGDAVAALLYDPDKRVVLFTDQFRAATIPMPELNRAGSKRGGWIYETAAGIVGPNDKMEDVLKNRLVKETGYQVSATVEIASFYPSPGGCSELIKLYYAEVRLSEKDGQGSENEIKLVDRSVDLFFKQLANREFEDAKLIIAGYWLKDRLQRDEDNRPQYRKEWYRLTKGPKRFIG